MARRPGPEAEADRGDLTMTDPTDDNRWADDFGDDTWRGGSDDPR